MLDVSHEAPVMVTGNVWSGFPSLDPVPIYYWLQVFCIFLVLMSHHLIIATVVSPSPL